MSREIVFKALFPFCGLGAGARGFLDASMSLLGFGLRFECVGGIDLDADACRDFDYLTGAPSWCADVDQITGAMLRERYGPSSPDCVFLSPPCKGASGLLPKHLAGTEKYQQMNRLALTWMRAMLDAWRDDPPKLVLLENVPRLRTRAKAMLDEVKRLLRGAGYLLHEGFHDCGEIGGLAQRRRRYLLVARLKARCPNLIYQPPKKRVRACGEVLRDLPVPATAEAREFGKIHDLPRISWLNWVRLALIPPGGDWRDLAGVLAEGQQRRAVFKRHEVAPWTEPTGVVTGGGANAVGHVADPRVEPWSRRGTMGILPWDAPAGAVCGESRPSNGRFSIADPRSTTFNGVHGVMPWDAPARTVVGGRSDGAINVADPRGVELGCTPREGCYRVHPWDKPHPTVVGKTSVDSGANVADPRVRYAYDAGYAVLSWEQAARTIAGTAAVGCGAYAVAEPREGRPPFNVELDAALQLAGAAPKKPPPFLPVIVSADGTWHRPLTTLELASLQGIPTTWNGAPLVLAGRSQSAWRERIGNAVPVGAARAIAEKMLITLGASALESFVMDGGAVWVTPSGVELEGMMLEEVHG